MDFTGKVAIVTGGSRDIGRSVSVRLAALGAKVCVNYFDSPADAEETLSIIERAGGKAMLCKGDMTKRLINCRMLIPLRRAKQQKLPSGNGTGS